MKNITKHNRPINTVLKEYVERHKGKIVEARKELQRRFNGLDWNIQKKILIAHLKSSKSDREWAYTLLLNYWDERLPKHCPDRFLQENGRTDNTAL